MAHVNQQVRDAVKAALLGGAVKTIRGTAGPDLLDVEFPAAVVATDGDQAEPWSKGPPVQEVRSIELTVFVVSAGDPETLADELDTLRSAIETAVNGSLGVIARRLQHTAGETTYGQDEETDRWVGFLLLTWVVDVVTDKGNPEVAFV
ncbi:MAG: hypothetical protein OEW52_00060 [Thermoleophilia bacterium]|nr:hypothetical protein [Thermoleophilia bacterium]